LRRELTKGPLFSVVIATYNRAGLLPRAITSVLSQTYQNFELIVVDDCSTDNTEEVVGAFKKDGRIIYHRLIENKGPSAARNKGLDLAKGDYIAFLDSDDELLPGALETAVSKFAELSPQGVGVIWFDDIDSVTGSVTGRGISKDGYMSYEDHLCDRIQGDFWVVLGRTALDGLRFDERTWDERLLWLRLYRRAKVFHVAKGLYLVHREHHTTVSTDFRVALKHKEKFLWSKRVLLTEYGQELKSLCPTVYGRSLTVLGFYLILNDEKSGGRRALFESLKFCFSLSALALAFLSYVLSESQIAFLYTKYKDVTYHLRRPRWLMWSMLVEKKMWAKK
jgi:glycosyltransferase involved in cell wall biosynthesis